MFIQSTDAQRAAPVLVQCISEFDLWEDVKGPATLRKLIAALQLYVGPLDVPRLDVFAGQQKACQKKTMAWWRENKNKRPVYWMLDSLARRGYSTGRPADVEKTAQGLLSALREGGRADRYAASRVLAYVLPDGDGIPLVDEGVCEPQEESRQSQEESRQAEPATPVQYLRQLVLCRAVRWAFWDCHRYTWSPDAARYVLKGEKTREEGKRVQ